jgi:hypothetical protein
MTSSEERAAIRRLLAREPKLTWAQAAARVARANAEQGHLRARFRRA